MAALTLDVSETYMPHSNYPTALSLRLRHFGVSWAASAGVLFFGAERPLLAPYRRVAATHSCTATRNIISLGVRSAITYVEKSGHGCSINSLLFANVLDRALHFLRADVGATIILAQISEVIRQTLFIRCCRWRALHCRSPKLGGEDQRATICASQPIQLPYKAQISVSDVYKRHTGFESTTCCGNSHGRHASLKLYLFAPRW